METADARARGAITLAAAAALAIAIQIPKPLALVFLFAALLLTAAAALSRQIPWAGTLAARPSLFVGRAVVLVATPLLARWLNQSLPTDLSQRQVVVLAITTVIIVLAWVCLGDGAASRWSFYVLLLVVWITGLIVVLGTDPRIDVYVYQVDSSRALFGGSNPYALTFPDPHLPADSRAFFGPGLSVNGVLMFGFPYPPLGLLLVAPAELVLGDFRIAHLTAIVAAAALIGLLRQDVSARASAMILVVLAPTGILIGFGWTEPLLGLFLALTVLVFQRKGDSTPYLFGLLVSLKQYMPLVLPAYQKLLPQGMKSRDVLRHSYRAIGIAAIVILPFFAINPGAFWHSVVELQFKQPLRPDALSYVAEFVRRYGSIPEVLHTLIPLAAATTATVACWRLTPSGARGFALMVAFVLLSWFAFTKQSFGNHYYTPLAALCVAAAVAPSDRERTAEEEDSSRPLEVRGS